MKHRLCMLTLSLALGIATAQTTTPPDAKTTSMAASGSTAPAEMKTSTFKGMLVDMECASNPSAASAAPATTAAAKPTSDTTGNCAVSANSSRLGVKLNDGKTVPFDLVGNQRAQDAMKNDKRWNKELTANKPLHVTISGVMNGDKLIVSSIH